MAIFVMNWTKLMAFYVLLLVNRINTGLDVAFQVELTEECPVDTIVPGFVHYLTQSQLPGVSLQQTYNLIDDDRVSRLFKLNPVTGRLTTNARIDRETICPSQRTTLGSDLMRGPVNSQANLVPTSMHYLEFADTSPECVIYLNILIATANNPDQSTEPKQTTRRILVRLLIRDLNDNAPSWSKKSPIEVSFVETPDAGDNGWSLINRHQGKSVHQSAKHAKSIDKASDPDLGINGSISYRLVGPGSEYFHLESSDDRFDQGFFRSEISSSSMSPSSQSNLRIWPITALDRETDDIAAGRGGFFNLTLLAIDAGSPSLTGSVALAIRVIDVNDHAPTFHTHNGGEDQFNSRHPYSGVSDTPLVVYRPLGGNVRETVPVGTVITQLNATDRDDGLHAQLTYSFCPCELGPAKQFFAIDSQNGRVTVARQLDFDRGPRQFYFKVIAKDGAPEPYTLTGTAAVEVHLSDENDESPEIKVLLVNASSSTSGSDPMLHLTSNINRQHIPHQKQLTSGTSVKFLGEYRTSISENPQSDTILAYIQVFDRDYYGQDRVHCRLGEKDNFTLEPDLSSGRLPNPTPFNMYDSSDIVSGDMKPQLTTSEYRLTTGDDYMHSTTSSRIDREASPLQQVTITCTDSVGNAALVSLSVTLVDVNDHSPEFINNGRFVFQIAEHHDLSDGKPVWLGRAMATDADEGENARLVYRLETEFWPGVDQLFTDGMSHIGAGLDQLFEIDAKTGDLYAKTVFDREELGQDGKYTFLVSASDHGSPQLTGSATIEVYILDVNDWAPQFTRDVYTFSILEDTPIHEVIGSIEAIDRDSDSRGKITYSLLPYEYSKDVHFRMTRSSNPSTLKETDTSADTGVNAYEEKITQNRSNSIANDTESLSLETNSDLISSPNTVKDARSIDIVRSSSSNSHQLNDPFGKAHFFAIDQLTGKLRLIRPLDRESNAFFSLQVIAVDEPPENRLQLPSGSKFNRQSAFSHRRQRLTATATVVVAVLDVNDNSPVFKRPDAPKTFSLRLQESPGWKLMKVEAIDSDEGENARIKYSIKSEVPSPLHGPGTGYFAIDESSGILFTTKSFNSSTSHRLIVEACDLASQNNPGSSRRCSLSPIINVKIFDNILPGQIPLATDLRSSESLVSSSIEGELGIESKVDVLLGASPLHDTSGESMMTHRNEIVVICLVVTFSVLLIATIILIACLVYRRNTGRYSIFVRSSDTNGHDKINGLRKGKPASNNSWLDEDSGSQSGDDRNQIDSKMELSKCGGQYDAIAMPVAPGSVNYFTTPFPINPPTAYPPGHQESSSGMDESSSQIGPNLDPDVTLGCQERFTTSSNHRGHPAHQSIGSNNSRIVMNSPMSKLFVTPDGRVMEKMSTDIADTNLLTQSTYKPSSSTPGYQSLDEPWGQIPQAVTNLRQQGVYRNPVNLIQPDQRVPIGAHYSVGQSIPMRSPNCDTEFSRRPVLHSPTYYEIASGRTSGRENGWTSRPNYNHHHSKSISDNNDSQDSMSQHLSDHRASSSSQQRSYARATATLGRPGTGKLRRDRSIARDSSLTIDRCTMYNEQAGDLALSNAILNSTERQAKQKSDTKNDNNAGDDNDRSQTTYQAYREGTFV